MKAYVNHGRWLVDCPNCGGAEIVFMGKPFVCKSRITNGFHGESVVCGYTVEVEFPSQKREIEAALIERSISNRNWTNESLDALKEENRIHNVPIRR